MTTQPTAEELHRLGARLMRTAYRVRNGIPIPREDAGTVSRIISLCAEEYGFNAGDLRGPRRNAPLFKARAEAMLRLREHGLTLGQIGRWFNRDHTTVINALERARVWRELTK